MVLPRHADEQIVYDEPLGETLAQLCASRPLFERRAASCSFRGVDIRSLCKKGGRTDVRFSYWETALGLVPHRSPRPGDLGTPESRPTAHWFHAHHPLRFLRSELDGRNFCKPSVRRQTRAATSDSRYLPRLSSGGIDNLSPAQDRKVSHTLVSFRPLPFLSPSHGTIIAVVRTSNQREAARPYQRPKTCLGSSSFRSTNLLQTQLAVSAFSPSICIHYESVGFRGSMRRTLPSGGALQRGTERLVSSPSG